MCVRSKLCWLVITSPDSPDNLFPTPFRPLLFRLVSSFDSQYSSAWRPLLGKKIAPPTTAGLWRLATDAFIVNSQDTVPADRSRRACRGRSPRGAIVHLIDRRELLVRVRMVPHGQ